jgi:hypothetical protein
MCPVCGARFRGAAACSRCGADLTIPMQLLARAFHLRQAARQAILEGDAARARALASQAQKIHRTETGRRLLYLSGSLLNLEVTH